MLKGGPMSKERTSVPPARIKLVVVGSIAAYAAASAAIVWRFPR